MLQVNGLGRGQVLAQFLGNRREFDSFFSKNPLQRRVTNDDGRIRWVLELLDLDVLPKRSYDPGPGVHLDAKDVGESSGQLVLLWRIIELESDGCGEFLVTFPLDFESLDLRSSPSSVPDNGVILRVQIRIELYSDAAEEGGEFGQGRVRLGIALGIGLSSFLQNSTNDSESPGGGVSRSCALLISEGVEDIDTKGALEARGVLQGLLDVCFLASKCGINTSFEFEKLGVEGGFREEGSEGFFGEGFVGSFTFVGRFTARGRG